jgi:predicted SAM-dependent methyltransferase
MNINRVQHFLKQVPLVGSGLKWSRDTIRSIVGPRLLRKRVEERAARGEPIQIIIGAGGIGHDKGWIPTNVQFLDLLKEEDWQRGFGDHRIDAIFAEHVWEHMTPADGKAGAAQCFKYLKPGGLLRIAVPDGNHPDPDYHEFVRPGGPGPGAYDHKVLYTYDMLRAMLESVGFKVDLLEYYDAERNFHRMPWDPKQGRVYRCQGWTEKKRDGSIMHYTSLIADARKPG